MPGRSWFRKENERFVLAGVVALVAAVVLFARLGAFGFWDPHEIAIADKATRLYERGGYLELWKTELPLTEWVVATGVAVLGKHELAARLPLALLGLVAALATYALGARLRRPRAGLFAALALVASPLFLFQSRQLTSDIGAITGQAVALCGLAGLGWPCANRRGLVPTILDVGLVVLGLAMGLFGAGLVLGVVLPLAAASVAAAFGAGRTGDEPRRLRLLAIVTGVISVALLYVAADLVFHFEAAQPGKIAVFGQMAVASNKYLPLLGGAWRLQEAPVQYSFNWIVNQVAFGMFPWSALAPIAVLRLAFPRARDRFSSGGVLVLAWATVGYLFAALWVRSVGEVRYAALPAIALAIGFFLDDVLGARLEGEDERAPGARDGLPVAAVFVFLAGFILSLDVRNMAFEKTLTDVFASLPVLGAAINVPREIGWLVYVLLFFGVVFAAAAAIALGVPGGEGRVLKLDRRVLVRSGIFATVATGGVFALFVASVYTPKLAQHYSHRNIFEAYFEHRRGAEPLGVMGITGSGPDYYARGRVERFTTTGDLLDFLKSPERVFAIVPSDKLCAVHQANTKTQVKYHVVDDRNSRFYLFSNMLTGAEKDLSPLVTSFHKAPPARMDRVVEATWEDTVDLLGVDMPERARKGETFTMTLWFRVKKRFSSAQQLLMHFDHSGSPVRFQADHHPKSCSTTYWQPGDIVSDTFEVKAGELTHPRGTYTVYTGFFTGGGGIWKNMTVTAGNHLTDNRVPLGTIRVE